MYFNLVVHLDTELMIAFSEGNGGRGATLLIRLNFLIAFDAIDNGTLLEHPNITSLTLTIPTAVVPTNN